MMKKLLKNIVSFPNEQGLMYHIIQKEDSVKSGIWKETEHDCEDKITQVGFKDSSRKGENERCKMKHVQENSVKAKMAVSANSGASMKSSA